MKERRQKSLHRRKSKLSAPKRFLIGFFAVAIMLGGGAVAYADATGTNLADLVVNLVDQIEGSTGQTASSDMNNLNTKYKNAADQTIQDINNNTENTLQTYEKNQVSSADSQLNGYLTEQQKQLNDTANQEIQKGEQSIQSQVSQSVQTIQQQIQQELENELQQTEQTGQSNKSK